MYKMHVILYILRLRVSKLCRNFNPNLNRNVRERYLKKKGETIESRRRYKGGQESLHVSDKSEITDRFSRRGRVGVGINSSLNRDITIDITELIISQMEARSRRIFVNSPTRARIT